MTPDHGVKNQQQLTPNNAIFNPKKFTNSSYCESQLNFLMTELSYRTYPTGKGGKVTAPDQMEEDSWEFHMLIPASDEIIFKENCDGN